MKQLTLRIVYCVLGFILALSYAATYKVVVNPDSYTNDLDPNDALYRAQANNNLNLWFQQFGRCERTVIFYNLSLFADKIDKIEKLLTTTATVDTTTTALDINEPVEKKDNK